LLYTTIGWIYSNRVLHIGAEPRIRAMSLFMMLPNAHE
jgi:hypothetical protein